MSYEYPLDTVNIVPMRQLTRLSPSQSAYARSEQEVDRESDKESVRNERIRAYIMGQQPEKSRIPSFFA